MGDSPLLRELVIGYGSNGYFLFTVGGFHPSFNPGTLELPRVARVGVSLSLGIVWLKQEMYLAITSNTFQLGARVEAGIEIGPGPITDPAAQHFHPFAGGLWHGLAGQVFGSCATFATLGDAGSAPGQLPLDDVLSALDLIGRDLALDV